MEDNKGNKRQNNLRKIIVAILVVVIVISGTGVAKQYLDNKRALEEYKRLAELAQVTTEAPTQVTTAAETQAEEVTTAETEPETENYASPIDFDKLKAINPDVVGWIRIPGTRVDYPIVQGTDNDKYLHTSFEGQESIAGAVYLDFESDADMLGWNNILYGHNMKNGSMFKDVIQYKDKQFFKEHQEFYIYTPERTLRLKAVAAYYGEAKPIVRKTRFKSQESFDAFFQEMTAPCTYADIPDVKTSALYTLVTCSYEINDARTFLFAVDMDQLEGKSEGKGEGKSDGN